MEHCESVRSLSSFHSAVVLTATLFAGSAGERTVTAAPARLAVYYGYPSAVNGANGSLDRAVQAFADYDVIVLGDGLELTAIAPGGAPHPDRAFTMRLIERLHRSPRQPKIHGYVDLGNSQRLSSAEVLRRISQWADMGVDGIFFDEAGFDYGVRRERQNDAVLATHSHGLSAFLNAFQPADIFATSAVALNAAGGGNPLAVAPVVNDRDLFLLESFAVRNGTVEAPGPLAARTRAALNGRRAFGTRIFGVATSDGTDGNPALSPYAWWTAALFGLDGYGWGTPNYSATNSRLPFVPPPADELRLRTAEYVGEADVTAARWRRATTLGTITVDAETRSGRLVPR
jgi:hypothetical protein